MKKVRKVTIGVVFMNSPKGTKFLLLRRVLGWKGWEFPKGGVEKGESEEKAVLREIVEETSLKKIKIIKKLTKSINYRYPKNYQQKYGFSSTSQRAFIVEAYDTKVKVERGVFDYYNWLTGKQALRRLKWDNQRKLLRSVLKHADIKK